MWSLLCLKKNGNKAWLLATNVTVYMLIIAKLVMRMLKLAGVFGDHDMSFIQVSLSA